jgi:signal transduction histidine kinase
MSQLFRARLAAFLFTLVFFVGLLAALNLAAAIGQPFGGFFVGYSHAANFWQMEASTPPWWPVVANDILRYDDALITIDNQPYNSTAYTAYRAAQAAGRDSVLLVIRRDNFPIEVYIPLRTFTLGNYFDIKLPDLINGMGFWLLAVAVFRARAHDPVNRVFAIACALAGGAIWLTIPGLYIEAPILTRGLQLIWVPIASFVGVLFIHLTLLFPAPIRRPVVRWMPVLYAAMTIVVLLYIVSFVTRWIYGGTPFTNSLGTWANWAVIGSLGVGVAAYLARLARLLSQREASRRLRRQSAFLLFGVALAVPYVLVIVFRALAQGAQTYFWNGLDLRYLTLAVPIAFAFVILRYQTLQRIHPIVAAVFILAASALLASVVTWIMRLLEPNWVNALNWSPFVPLFLVALVTGIFFSLQNTLRGAFSKVFQWEFRSYTAVRKFSQQVVSQTDYASLPAAITIALIEKLELDCASVWLWDASNRSYRLAGRAGKWPVPPPDLLPAGEPTHGLVRPVRLTTETDAAPGWLDSVRQIGTVEVVAPLSVSGEAVGLLGLGKRWDEEIFDNRDLEIIELVAQQAALFILTAQQIEQLRQVPHQITTAQERERFKIAQELHDTVQQFLGRLPFYLQVSRDNARVDPAETESILQRCIADVESAAQAVRQIRHTLAPLQLETSLVQPLTTLVDSFRARTGLETQSDFSPAADSQLGPEARHALYRVVQQALDNVAAHARASRVTVTLHTHNDHLHFLVADNGRGVTDAERRKAEARGSFGLLSMRARITALGGEFNFDSSPETGTQISGWLPLSQ